MSFDPILAAFAVAAGYAIGSLPFGSLVAKANGVDIFSVGSRNPGATNVKRMVGKKAGNLVFALDFLKGFIATFWPAFANADTDNQYLYGLLGLVFAVLGHSFSMFTKFRGGKGVATMLGGVAALMPWAALVGVAVWLASFYTTRYVSVASILLAVSLPITNFLTGQSLVLIWVSLALAVVVIARHKSNIARLMRGEENRFDRKSSQSSGEEAETKGDISG